MLTADRHSSAVFKIALFSVFLGIFIGLPHGIPLAAPNARAVLLYNLDTDRVLYEKNGDLQISPASLTKIMTLFLTLDDVKARKASLTQKIRITPEAAAIGGSSLRIRSGERLPLSRLIAASAVVSGNDATMAIAEHIGGTSKNFVDRMNRKARKLGLKKTRFKNPTGLPARGQLTTARDLLLLCRAYLRAHPEAMRFHNMQAFLHKGFVKRNTNPLLGQMPGVNGLKTGWTVSSGYHLIITAKRNNTRLLAIVLGCPSKEDRLRAAAQLVDAGFKNPAKPRHVAMLMKK